MIPLAISDATRRLAEGQDEYTTLHVRDKVFGCGTPAMETLWEPTPTELATLFKGGSVMLTVLGREWPPVSLTVQEPSE